MGARGSSGSAGLGLRGSELPPPLCGEPRRRRADRGAGGGVRKCLVIDSRTFKYPPCNKNRLPARQTAASPSAGTGRRSAAGAGRAERSAAEPSRAGRPRSCPESRRPHRGFAPRRGSRPLNKAVRRGGLPVGERCRAAARWRSGRLCLSSLVLGACSREAVVVWVFFLGFVCLFSVFIFFLSSPPWQKKNAG